MTNLHRSPPMNQSKTDLGIVNESQLLRLGIRGLRRQKLAISFSGFRWLANHDSVVASERTMRPKKHEPTGLNDLFRARLDQIINMQHELVQLAGKIDWDFIDGEIAPLYRDKGRPGIATR